MGGVCWDGSVGIELYQSGAKECSGMGGVRWDGSVGV